MTTDVFDDVVGVQPDGTVTVSVELALNEAFAGAVNVMVNVVWVPVTTELGEIVNVPLPLMATAGLTTRLRPDDVEPV